ncbi:hypothetical protein, partial [Klebsiella variicola]|uniref:hypothetical protein n=1 Tax=Klebsiella variicola TaxID=244366 RepID=UPI0039C15450
MQALLRDSIGHHKPPAFYDHIAHALTDSRYVLAYMCIGLCSLHRDDVADQDSISRLKNADPYLSVDPQVMPWAVHAASTSSTPICSSIDCASTR